MSGCTWTSFVTLGRAGNNPFCHHRALEMQKAGKREHVVERARRAGRPVSTTASSRSVEAHLFFRKWISRRIAMTKADLFPCPGCARHVRVSETVCPFCHGALNDGFRSQRAPGPPAMRLGRAALLAVGAGTIALASSCSSASVKPPYRWPATCRRRQRSVPNR